MAVIIQLRRDTAANWTANNPTPGDGELCLETDTLRYKIGDSSGTQWTSLGYASLPAGAATLNGPAFTGVPTAPTAAVGTDTTQLATTAFVQANGTSVLEVQVFS